MRGCLSTGAFYTQPYNYNHAHRLRLETDFLNHFWIQVAVSLLILKPPCDGFRSETAVTWPWPFQKRNGYKFMTAMCNGHSPTAGENVRSVVTVMAMQGPWPFVKGNDFVLGSGVTMFAWLHLGPTNTNMRFVGKGSIFDLCHWTPKEHEFPSCLDPS